jgi:excisionase family DNA binding protein
MENAPTKTYYTVSEIAAIKGVTTQAVRDWINAGDLPAKKANPKKQGSPFRIPKTTEVEKFIEGEE